MAVETLQFTASGYVFTSDAVLETMQCGECGIPFAMPRQMLDWARTHPEVMWYCPAGHIRHFPGKTLEQKLADAQEALAREQARHDQTAASLHGERIAKSRFKNERDQLRQRAAAGVCPCCNRTFQQLSRHMKSKHPGFQEEALG